MRKKASIIIPTHNRGEKLVETIESIEKNDFPKKDFEIIIVNDASPDNTNKIVAKFKKRYSNIIYIKNKENKGPAGARNRGIKKAKGELIFFTDDDCLVPANWIKDYWKFFRANPEVYGAGGILQAKQKNWISKIEGIKDKMLGISYKTQKIGGQEIKTGFTNNCVYRKKAFKEVGYFSERFSIPAGEDLEFNQRVAAKHKVAFVPIVVLHNHRYDLDYLLDLVWKQGAGEMPPKRWKLIKLIPKIPRAIYKIIKKIIGYRK